MNDPRTTPDPDLVSQNTPARITIPVADLNRLPGAKRDRQVLFGEQVTILQKSDDYCYVITEKDDYVGYIHESAICADHVTTHRISSIASHIYSEPNMKSAERHPLSHGSLIKVIATSGKFAQTPEGYIPIQHICPISESRKDYVSVAKLFLGTPYLWGGNSNTGIDCSGLVQAALTACNLPCPGDSDQQQSQLGCHLAIGSKYQKGDLLFWKGHVALAINDNTLIHANAYHMACVYEPIDKAVARIKAQGDGELTAHKRLT